MKNFINFENMASLMGKFINFENTFEIHNYF